MIHVLIERRIADGMVSTYEELARGALHRCYIAPGFIAGEAFSDAHSTSHKYVLCKWRSEQDWHRWSQSPERMEVVNKISPILLEPEKVTILKN